MATQSWGVAMSSCMSSRARLPYLLRGALLAWMAHGYPTGKMSTRFRLMTCRVRPEAARIGRTGVRAMASMRRMTEGREYMPVWLSLY